MKHRNRVLVALLAMLMLLTFAAPLAQALESAPFAAIQGAPARFVVFGKFKNDGSVDKNTQYSDFTSVTVENTNIAEAYMIRGMWYIFCKAADANTTFTATLANGETVTGTIASVKGKWRGSSSWYGGGWYTAPFVGISPATSYAQLNGSLNLSMVGTGKTPSSYTWAYGGSIASLTVSGNVVTAIASNTAGTGTVTATDNANGTRYTATIYVYDPATLALSALPTITVNRGYYSYNIYPPYPQGWYATKSGTWSVWNNGIASIRNNSDGSISVYGYSQGTTTYTFTDTATGKAATGTINVIY